MKWTALACLVPFVTTSPLQSRSADAPAYDGYQIWSVTPASTQEARHLERRFSTYHTHPIRDSLSIAIPPEEVTSFQSLGLKARLINEDLGAYIRATDKEATYNRLHKRGDLPDLSWFDTYHEYADHLTYWDDLTQAFPDNSEKFEIGKSYENRTIFAYHLFGDENEGDGEGAKPAILWHATVHAREVGLVLPYGSSVSANMYSVDLNHGD